MSFEGFASAKKWSKRSLLYNMGEYSSEQAFIGYG